MTHGSTELHTISGDTAASTARISQRDGWDAKGTLAVQI